MGATGVSDLEHRIGIVPLDELLAERQVLVTQVARLRALYGPGGTADALRSIEHAKCRALVRAEAVAAGLKKTEAELDELSKIYRDYIGFVAEMTQERADWTELEAKIEAVDFTIQRGQALARFASAEARL